MGDWLWAGKPSWCVTSRLGQLSLSSFRGMIKWISAFRLSSYKFWSRTAVSLSSSMAQASWLHCWHFFTRNVVVLYCFVQLAAWFVVHCRRVGLAKESTSTQVRAVVPADDLQWDDELDWWLAWGESKSSMCNTLRSGSSIANQIKFDLRFTDLWLTWCSELIVNQLCFFFPCIIDLQLRDRRLADLPTTEPTLCQSDWLTADLDLQYCAKLPSMQCKWTLASKRHHSNDINDIVLIVCCQK